MNLWIEHPAPTNSNLKLVTVYTTCVSSLHKMYSWFPCPKDDEVWKEEEAGGWRGRKNYGE